MILLRFVGSEATESRSLPLAVPHFLSLSLSLSLTVLYRKHSLPWLRRKAGRVGTTLKVQFKDVIAEFCLEAGKVWSCAVRTWGPISYKQHVLSISDQSSLWPLTSVTRTPSLRQTVTPGDGLILSQKCSVVSVSNSVWWTECTCLTTRSAIGLQRRQNPIAPCDTRSNESALHLKRI